MDVQMPVMDGFEASRSIRQGDSLICKIPIIALTAHTNQSIIERCTESGMNDYIPKPFTPGELQEILLRYTGKKSEAKSSLPVKSVATEKKTVTDFDLTYLIQVSNHDRSFIGQILNSFLTNAEATLLALRADLKENEIGRISSLVHKIKPSLTMIGAETARQLASELENMTNEGGAKSKIKSGTKEFCSLLEKTISGLRALDLRKV
jgi:DNA-binding response OmpR family regulator